MAVGLKVGVAVGTIGVVVGVGGMDVGVKGMGVVGDGCVGWAVGMVVGEAVQAVSRFKYNKSRLKLHQFLINRVFFIMPAYPSEKLITSNL